MTFFNKKARNTLALSLLTFSLFTSNTSLALAADDYPNHTMQMVTPYPPGGPTDIMARIASIEMSKVLDQSIIVDNKPGASGMIGSEKVARAKPDGYTFLANASIHIINPSVYSDMSHDPIKDFEPITQLVAVPLVLVVPKDSPFNDINDIIEEAKKHPDTLNYGSAGTASAQQLSSELLKILANVKMQHIPYKGSSPALADLAGNRLDFMFDSMPSAMPFIEKNQLKALAVSTSERVDALPDVPTVAEAANLPDFDVSTWYGLWAPKNTPKPILTTLWKAAKEALSQPDIIEKYKKLGAVTVTSSPEEFKEFNQAEYEKWKEIIEISGTKIE